MPFLLHTVQDKQCLLAAGDLRVEGREGGIEDCRLSNANYNPLLYCWPSSTEVFRAQLLLVSRGVRCLNTCVSKLKIVLALVISTSVKQFVLNFVSKGVYSNSVFVLVCSQ